MNFTLKTGALFVALTSVSILLAIKANEMINKAKSVPLTKTP